MVDRAPDYADEQLDRLAARSLAASERSQGGPPPAPKRSILPWLLTTAAVAFALGLIANPWFESAVRSRLPAQFQHPSVVADPAVTGRVDALEARVAQLESKPATVTAMPAPDELAARLTDLEADAMRLAAADLGAAARMEQLASAASSSAAGQGEVKALFLLSAARRFVEAGRPFGALERMVTAGFSARDPVATEALAAWSAAPHSRGSLKARLHGPVPAASVALPQQAGWWDRLVARLSGVVQVRGEEAQAADSETRDKALDALAAGDLARAIAIFDMAPPSRARDLWLADARRLLAAEQALDSLETALLSTSIAEPPASPAQPPPPAMSTPNTKF
jgi:hypothetical protein